MKIKLRRPISKLNKEKFINALKELIKNVEKDKRDFSILSCSMNFSQKENQYNIELQSILNEESGGKE